MAESRQFQKEVSRSGANLIFGSGEMADLIRAFDWRTTSLGPIEDWSESLLITVNTLLGNRQPELRRGRHARRARSSRAGKSNDFQSL
jgi:hypothetical protein